MAIENFEGELYTAVCDECGEELPPEFDWNDAVIAMREEKWQSKYTDDGWINLCPDCVEFKSFRSPI